MLGALGRQLAGDERVELAVCLPTKAALAFTSQIPDPQPFTGWGFVKDLATPHRYHSRGGPLGHRSPPHPLTLNDMGCLTASDRTRHRVLGHPVNRSHRGICDD